MHSPDPHSSGPLAYALERWRSLRTKCVWPDDIHDPSPPSVPIMPTCCAAAWPRCNLISRCSGNFNRIPSGISKQPVHCAAGRPPQRAGGECRRGRLHGPYAPGRH
jgi:hypothetical protein